MMRTRALLVWVGVFVVAAGLAVAATAPQAEPQTEMDVTLCLPAGDPAAGRAAFLELSCTSCHAVVGEADFPAPVAHHAGPELAAATAGKTPGPIASSIVAPSHEIGPEVRKMMEGKLSPMGDFSDAMTVRQLIDLVAYLGSLDER
jgi:hypothetical protein